jgi:tetratricopeptide (TPR) repeat protein
MRAYILKGDALRNTNDWKEAVRAFLQGAGIANEDEQGVRASAVSSDALLAKEKAAEILGTLHEDWKQARPLFEEVLIGRRTLVEQQPDNLEWQYNLASALMNISDTSVGEGRSDEALAPLKEANSIIERISQRDPDNRKYLTRLTRIEVKMGDLQLDKDPTTAYALFEKVHQRRSELAKDDPGDLTLARDLSVILRRLGETALLLQRPHDALLYFDQAHQISSGLLQRSTCDPVWVSDRGASELGRGLAFEGVGRAGEAITSYMATIEAGRIEMSCRRNVWAGWKRLVARATTALARLEPQASADLSKATGTIPNCAPLCKTEATCESWE